MRTKLIEVCGILFLLTFIALGGIANQWNGCSPYFSLDDSVDYTTAELKNMLQLDDQQTAAIKNINDQYYDDVAKVYAKHSRSSIREISMLTGQRRDKIMNVLYPEQKHLWQNVHEVMVKTTGLARDGL
jgi:hypothetical protein